MDITPELLRQAMGCRRERAELFGRALDDACDAYGLASPRVLAAFLAQLGHESGSLEHVREVWGPTDAQRRYERDFTAPWPEGETQAWQSAFTRNRLAWRLGNTEAGDAVYEPFSGSGTTIIAAVMTAVIVMLWATLPASAQPASAPAADQPCGQGGTALRVGQGPVTLTDAEATAQQVRIRADGHWWTCEVPAVMPPPREPAACLLGRTPVEYLSWQVGPHRCTTDRAVHTGIAHGETRELRAIWGATVGQIRYHCVDGTARVIGDPACAPAPQQCTGYVRWTVAGRVYSYDGNSAPVPVGRTATATAPDGATINLRCDSRRRWVKH